MNNSSLGKSPEFAQLDTSEYIKVKQIKKYSFGDKFLQLSRLNATAVGTSPELPISALSFAQQRPTPDLKK